MRVLCRDCAGEMVPLNHVAIAIRCSQCGTPGDCLRYEGGWIQPSKIWNGIGQKTNQTEQTKPDQTRFGDEVAEGLDEISRLAELEELIEYVFGLSVDAPELNMNNYDEDDISSLNEYMIQICGLLGKAVRTKPPEPTKPDWKWQLEEDWVRAIAMDEDKEWCRFGSVPIKSFTGWFHDGRSSLSKFRMHPSTYPEYSGPWQDSLMIRPEGDEDVNR